MPTPRSSPLLPRRGSLQWVGLLLACLLTCLPLSAQAFPSEGQVWTGVGANAIYETAPSSFGWWGPAASVGGVFLINDFWRFTADTSFSYHPSRTLDDATLESNSVWSAALGLRYALDILIYVPYVGLSVVAHPLSPPSSTNPGGDPLSLRATLGVDYRANRRYSIGAALEGHAPMTRPADFPHLASVRVHLGIHFRRF